MVSDNLKLQNYIADKVDAASAKAYKKQISEVREETVSDKEGKVLKKEELNATNETTTLVSNLVVAIIAVVFIVLIVLLIRRRRQSANCADADKTDS